VAHLPSVYVVLRWIDQVQHNHLSQKFLGQSGARG
jgi:hypothetical protein